MGLGMGSCLAVVLVVAMVLVLVFVLVLVLAFVCIPLSWVCQDNAVPLIVFGDGVQVVKGPPEQSMLCIGFMTMHSKSEHNLDARFLITAWAVDATAKRQVHGQDSMDALFAPIAWSLEVCFRAVRPSIDHMGIPFAAGSQEELASGQALFGKHFFVVWRVAGDREFFERYLGYPHNASLRPCPYCRCESNPGPRNVRNYAPDAEWTTTLTTPREVPSQSP